MSKARTSASPTTYRAAYAQLARIAAELESGEADLDHVLPLLQEAQVAYARCQERIEAVRGVLAGDFLAASGDEPENEPEDESEDATDEA